MVPTFNTFFSFFSLVFCFYSLCFGKLATLKEENINFNGKQKKNE